MKSGYVPKKDRRGGGYPRRASRRPDRIITTSPLYYAFLSSDPGLPRAGRETETGLEYSVYRYPFTPLHAAPELAGSTGRLMSGTCGDFVGGFEMYLLMYSYPNIPDLLPQAHRDYFSSLLDLLYP